MKRKDFFSAVCGTLALAAVPNVFAVKKRPNVLIIHTDQQANWTLSVYGGKLVGTPNLDSIGREGAVFGSFFTNAAMCTPSRGSFMSGLHPSSHGAVVNGIPMRSTVETFAHVLAKNGYDTGYAGKWHLHGDDSPGVLNDVTAMGFNDHANMWNSGHFKTIKQNADGTLAQSNREGREVGDEKSYTTDYLADRTIEFMRKPRSNSFCFMVSFPDPHTPFSVRKPYDKMFKADDMPLPVSFVENGGSTEENYDKGDRGIPTENEGKGGRKARTANGLKLGKHAMVSADYVKRSKALYCGMMKCIDDNVGKIITAMKAAGIYDDTIIIHSSDHGEMMGEHGRMHKGVPYQTAYRVPFLMRYPSLIRPGTVVDQVMSTADFKPTLLSMLGLSGAQKDEGFDRSGLCTGGTVQGPHEMHIQFIRTEDSGHAGIVTGQYLLAYMYDGKTIRPESTFFYDRIKDPEFMTNLFGTDRYLSIAPALLTRMKEKHAAMRSPQSALLETIRI
ncbi:MAG: sulfatase-like hydrolase/transferase [Spirochaetes bacterium]|nr:sulfatase-like hydrolase/transferase [Spirochaetota bacterium]